MPPSAAACLVSGLAVVALEAARRDERVASRPSVCESKGQQTASVEALAARLGADLALRITENTSRATALWELYQAKLREARSADGREGTADRLPEGSWLEARR